MLCEISESWGGNFAMTWFALSLLALVSIMSSSGYVFYHYYWPSQVTYEKWTRKSNPKYPSPEKVRDEIVQMLKGMGTASLCPAAALWLTSKHMTQTYCGFPGERGWGYFGFTFLAVWLGTDLWSWFYHRLGHMFSQFWHFHKHHHVFYNPSPFAVIADDVFDQLFRAAPMIAFPLLMPINMDLLFFEYAVFFYLYGVYLHWGYEVDWIDAHNPVLNTAFQHYCHHSKAILHKPYHCGFYLKLWDQLTGGMYPADKCFCSKCARAKGQRSRELWEKVVIPDYTLLLKPAFWFGSISSGANEKELTTEEQYFNKKQS